METNRHNIQMDQDDFGEPSIDVVKIAKLPILADRVMA
jgi:hypothetical protein